MSKRAALMGFLGGVIAWVVFSLAQAAVSEPVPIDAPDFSGKCLPADEGEKVLLWLEHDQYGGLQLHCEVHAVLGYGMASVPVSVE